MLTRREAILISLAGYFCRTGTTDQLRRSASATNSMGTQWSSMLLVDQEALNQTSPTAPRSRPEPLRMHWPQAYRP